MSIWKYKNIYGGQNNTPRNFNDARKMIKKGFISEKIIVYTHSQEFPEVNGYLRNELKKFYSRNKNKGTRVNDEVSISKKENKKINKSDFKRSSKRNFTFLGVVHSLIWINLLLTFIPSLSSSGTWPISSP